MEFIKVCGLTTHEQIDWAVELGYDAIGIVVSPSSKRYCPPAAAISLANYARGKILSFVVALKYEDTIESKSYFDIIQLYEKADIPNLAYSSATQPEIGDTYEYFFYDASVGSGVFKEIPEWVKHVPGKVVLAGGLNIENVQSTINHFDPYGLDVSSSLEISPGIKSKALMAKFIEMARSCHQVDTSKKI